ncbi:DUF4169 family protein [Qingshengfaniella alkalisoli]|uniref:DUF4169 family protein n=1 Tax=Qingshengfaniella alkalisoli TaxID=2599296 RepID=A0A5B8IX82_9RHOB|nr:DUF4169 family protein [Qingshengfaniella alkalisoli]QDY69178.1 DUF4169 family protein [Qingshengfaniella alkalisoli]
MTRKVVSLSKIRKARARNEKRATADANAVKFGRSKAKRDLDHARQRQSEDRLDAHRKDDTE